MFSDPLHKSCQAPEVQIGCVLGVICSHRLVFKKKKLEKFSETMRQTAQYNILTNILMQQKCM